MLYIAYFMPRHPGLGDRRMNGVLGSVEGVSKEEAVEKLILVCREGGIEVRKGGPLGTALETPGEGSILLRQLDPVSPESVDAFNESCGRTLTSF